MLEAPARSVPWHAQTRNPWLQSCEDVKVALHAAHWADTTSHCEVELLLSIKHGPC